MTNEERFDPLTMYDHDRVFRDPGTRQIKDFYGKIAGEYRPLDLCLVVLDVADAILSQHPGMSEKDLDDSLTAMRSDPEYCIGVQGDFGKPGHRLMKRFEVHWSPALQRAGIERGMRPAQACAEIMTQARALLMAACVRADSSAKFRAFKEETGHIWLELTRRDESRPSRLHESFVILVEESSGLVWAPIGIARADVVMHNVLLPS
jgi:hypothetical protein